MACQLSTPGDGLGDAHAVHSGARCAANALLTRWSVSRCFVCGALLATSSVPRRRLQSRRCRHLRSTAPQLQPCTHPAGGRHGTCLHARWCAQTSVRAASTALLEWSCTSAKSVSGAGDAALRTRSHSRCHNRCRRGQDRLGGVGNGCNCRAPMRTLDRDGGCRGRGGLRTALCAERNQRWRRGCIFVSFTRRAGPGALRW